MRRVLHLALALWGARCGGTEATRHPLDAGGDGGMDADSDSDSDSDGDLDADSDTDLDADTDGDSDSDGGTDCAPDDEVSPALVVGGCDEGWSEIECGESIEVFYGYQGTHHFYVCFKEHGLVLDDPAVLRAFDAVDDTGKVWAREPWEYVNPSDWAPSAEGDGWFVSTQQQFIISYLRPVDLPEVEERLLTITARLRDGIVEVSDTHKIHVWNDEH